MGLKVIGLCGGSGSGKGVVSSIFKKHGYLTIDTDMVYREITDKPSPCLKALVFEFGDGILNESGTLDRKKLGAVVFSDTEKLNKLNFIAHKFILSEVRITIEKAKGDNYAGVVVDAPLLFESGFDSECDVIVSVLSSRDIRIKRITARDAITEEAAIKRIDSQLSDKYLASKSDFVIYNNADINELEARVAEIVTRIN